MSLTLLERPREHVALLKLNRPEARNALNDPLRAELFAQVGIRTVCPTRDVRVALFDAVRACETSPAKEG